MEPHEIVGAVAESGPNPSHLLTVFGDASLRTAVSTDTLRFDRVPGYRALPASQPLMAVQLSSVAPSLHSAVCVQTQVQMDLLNEPSAYMLPAHLHDDVFGY